MSPFTNFWPSRVSDMILRVQSSKVGLVRARFHGQSCRPSLKESLFLGLVLKASVPQFPSHFGTAAVTYSVVAIPKALP